MELFYVAQGISILTALIAMVSMQFKNMRLILAGQIAANLLTALTYLLLGGLSGAGICIIAIFQSVIMFIFNIKKIKPHLAVVIGFVLLYVACSIYYFTSFIDVFSMLAAICFALSVTQEKPSSARIFYVVNPLLWMVYDIYVKAYVNLAMHAVIFISTAIAIIRLDIIRKKSD